MYCANSSISTKDSSTFRIVTFRCNRLVRIYDHVARNVNIDSSKPHVLTLMAAHCVLKTNGMRNSAHGILTYNVSCPCHCTNYCELKWILQKTHTLVLLFTTYLGFVNTLPVVDEQQTTMSWQPAVSDVRQLTVLANHICALQFVSEHA